MRFEAAIASFAAALADPAAPIPNFTVGRRGVPDVRRFAVYRNNVAVGLIGALEARFPVTRRLVGEEFFRATARAFVFARKPPTPLIIHYGRDFPEFVEAFAPARDIPYLGEVARLEDAWIEAYHAAEASPLTLNDLASVAPERVDGLTFFFHPAARLLSFNYPAASIWAAHQGETSPRGPAEWRPEQALVTRPHAEVLVRVLPPGGFALASALRAGRRLGEAAAALAAEHFDPVAHLIGLVDAGAIAALE
jgi:hypothetical protein